MLDYNLDESIIASATDKTRMHSYLSVVFSKIIVPMTNALRKIMVNFCFASEAELFTSDLHFKMFDTSDHTYYRSRDGPTKHEDEKEKLRSQVSCIIKRF